MKKARIYVCHTYYHVYVAFLKELNLPKEERGKATILLSSLSCQFEELKHRIDQTGLFEACIVFPERYGASYPELEKYRRPRNNLVLHLIQRIIYSKKLGKLTEKTVPVSMKDFKDIYVFCDADPIGYYLNWKRIPYHAMEDGLNSVANCNGARYDNRGHFELKAFLSERLNMIFIQGGYGKYCIDMEVNDISAIKYPYRKYVEVKRQELVDHLTQEDKDMILNAFIRNRSELEERMSQAMEKEKRILILTEPLCDLATREKIFRDLTAQYEKEGSVFIKPHPRDELDYQKLFGEYPQFDKKLPMEILNYFPNLQFDKVISVLTEISGIQFAKESIRLGSDFMDAYEDPKLHRQNEQI